MQDYEINVEWTLKSMKESFEDDKSEKGVCFSCAKDDSEIKEYVIAVKNNKLQWTDASGAVWEKVKVQYCIKCAKELIDSFEAETSSS